MIRTSTRSALAITLAAALLLPGCNAPKKADANALDTMDNELVDGTPVTEKGKLAAAIKVDRAATVPLGSVAARRKAGERGPVTSEDAATGGCLTRDQGKLAFDNGWAAKLPADLPLHPQAQLQEAAGHSGGCEIRAASFTVGAEPEAVLAWYENKAKAGGYDAGRTTRDGGVWLAGTKGDAAFTIMTSAAKGGTAVDYIWTKGA